MLQFPVPDDQLRKLKATQQGRKSSGGFDYQMAYAVARLASLEADRPVLGISDVPRILRYDWAEDVDELCDDDTALFTQCKHTSLTDKDKLAKVVISFIPKLLWADQQKASSVRFRVVTSDAYFARHKNFDSLERDLVDKVIRKAQEEIEADSSPQSDRTLWKDQCIDYGVEKIVRELIGRTQLLYVPGEQVDSSFSGRLYFAERRGLDLLLAERLVDPLRQAEAISALRGLLRENTFAKDFYAVIEQADTRIALLTHAPLGEAKFPFRVINQAFLEEQRNKPKRIYVARPPTWGDVVHGPDRDIKYIEREQLGELIDRIDQSLLKPLQHGNDSGIRGLFVVGAPGDGKSTLVRRAVSILVGSGKSLAVDFGLNQGAVSERNVEHYVKYMDHLSRTGKPVLLVMDDPFFSGSGWGKFLEEIGQPVYSNIAVVGASPTYLYDTYATKISGKRVHLESFSLNPLTTAERASIKTAYDQPGNSCEEASTEEAEFLVLAMEKAAGKPFDEIIKRIWLTLNDGEKISNKVRSSEVRWPFRAFLICSFLHRHDIACPESLLHDALVEAGPESSRNDYAEELAQLKWAEGWNLFQLLSTGTGDSSEKGIATLHSRLAQLAWESRPARGISPGSWILPVSYKPAHAAEIFAQFILSARARSTDLEDHKFASDLIKLWTSSEIPTPVLCRLTAELINQPDVVQKFRQSLRNRLKSGDSHAWLAAIQLMRMARRGSQEAEHLTKVDIPVLIRKADLSSDPLAAMELLRTKSHRHAVVERLWTSLDGDTSWSMPGCLMTWLLDNHVNEIKLRLERMLEWMDNDESSSEARLALIRWYRLQARSLTEQEHRSVVDRVDDWIRRGTDNGDIIAGFIAILPRLTGISSGQFRTTGSLISDIIDEWFASHPEETAIRSLVLDNLPKIRRLPNLRGDEHFINVFTWLRNDFGNEYMWASLLSVVKRIGFAPGVPMLDVVGSSVEWLENHPDSEHVRAALLSLVRRFGLEPGWPTEAVSASVEWLENHPDSEHVRAALLGLVRRFGLEPGWPTEAVSASVEWLENHPDSEH
ncbi:hypothetical protein AB0F88_06440, partial [Streptosporangium sp. NPDC023963]|uniref:hypothetical protein n=1 Tax=Streptosporangium sp. NPDC023963 TaxID=3155608 RepID=UPI0034430277